jgi:serine/threonine protein kinase
MSPQILSKNYYTYKCDVWSLGIIIYEMYFDVLPWKSQDAESLFFNIMKNPYPYADSKRQIPKIILFLLKSTLQYLESDRLSWADLLKAVSNINSVNDVSIPSVKKIGHDLVLPQNVHKSIPRWEI